MYAESKLLPSDATLQKIIVDPGLFIQLRLESKELNENRSTTEVSDNIVDLTAVAGKDNASSTAGSRLSHQSVE